MTLFYATITGVVATPEVYGGLVACKDYLGASVGDGATAFAALATDSDRSKYLVAATRYIDQQVWQGVADAFGGTTLQFPRTGLLDQYGAAASDAVQLALVSQAAFELTALICADADVQSAVDSGSNIESMGAGSARLAFFRPTSARDGGASVLPVVISRLIGRWLASAAAVGAMTGVATGGSTCDEFTTYAEDRVKWPV